MAEWVEVLVILLKLGIDAKIWTWTSNTNPRSHSEFLQKLGSL